jgi:hypothetical protein
MKKPTDSFAVGCPVLIWLYTSDRFDEINLRDLIAANPSKAKPANPMDAVSGVVVLLPTNDRSSREKSSPMAYALGFKSWIDSEMFDTPDPTVSVSDHFVHTPAVVGALKELPTWPPLSNKPNTATFALSADATQPVNVYVVDGVTETVSAHALVPA